MPEKSKPSTHPTSAATVLISTVPTFSPTTPSASTATAMTTNPTSEAAPVLNPTSMPETSKPSTELPSTSHPTSATTVLTSTGAAGSSSTPMSVSTDPPSSTVSNSSAGVLNPRIPKRIPVPTFSPAPATTAAPRHDKDFLKELVVFLEENKLLILVVGTLLLLVFLVICGSIFMSRRRKVNAYYPCSFPSKMYVDQRDKTGGAKPFNEVQEKAAAEQESEPVDSHKQLQADIMRAARSLRTPNKSADAVERSDPTQKVAEDSSKPDVCVLDQQLPSLPEEKELCEVPESEAAAAAESSPSEQLHPEKEDSQEPSTGKSLRPSSLHIHNDSATLQLIAGEKTAF
uniref:Transmembrane protein 119b n=1 Tax=Acanthochromis polyacanthus TaxID=80966 RepID=A0A3Q1F7B3_9TELE